jgi:elongation factor Ts
VSVPTDRLKELREKSGAGIMECRNALIQASGDLAKAQEILKEKSLYKAEKKKERTASQGVVECYVHAGGRVGAIVELNCETDFVARTEVFKNLAHELAMQVAAMSPEFVSKDSMPADSEADPKAVCLLLQSYIRDNAMTVQDLVTQAIGKTGENIKVARFTRFELGVS